jgi:hypothetical protein
MFMDHTRKTSFIFGLFFAGTFVFAIPAPFLYSSLLDGPGDIHLQGLETRIALGACTQVLLTICNVATAVVLFPLARRYSETLAFGYLAVRIIESLIILTGDISLLSVITLRNALPDAGTADAFNTAHHALLAVREWTLLFGPQFCSGLGNGLMLGFLMYRTRFMPRNMALLGLIGGPLALAGGVLVLFGRIGMHSPALLAFTALEIIWELSITVYAIARGFKAP